MRVWSRSQRLVLAALFGLALAGSAPRAEAADESSKQARADYDAGAAAYEKKDFATAAKHFARADERLPNPRALQLAMAAMLSSSGDPPLAMDLVERAETRAVDGSLAALAQRLRKRFASAAGRIRLVCPVDVPCHATVDDQEKKLEHGRTVWVTTGKHLTHVLAERGGSVDRELTVTAGATIDLAPSASDLPAPPPKVAAPSAPEPKVVEPLRIEPERTSKGLAPVYFWSALGVTVAGATAATIFTVMTKSAHDDFVANPSQQTADDGASAQTRARIVWGVTGALAVTTIAIGALTDFRGSGESKKSASIMVGPGSVHWVGRFQ